MDIHYDGKTYTMDEGLAGYVTALNRVLAKNDASLVAFFQTEDYPVLVLTLGAGIPVAVEAHMNDDAVKFLASMTRYEDRMLAAWPETVLLDEDDDERP